MLGNHSGPQLVGLCPLYMMNGPYIGERQHYAKGELI